MKRKLYYASEFIGGVYSVNPHRTVEVFEWLMGDEFRASVEKVRNAESKEEMDALKKLLPGITISGVFSKRNASGLNEPTNLILLDIDGKQNLHHTDMEKLKQLIFALPYVRLAMLSCSGGGVLAIVELADYHNLYQHFLALQEDLAAINIIIDPACKDLPRFRFASYDPNPLYREDANIYIKLNDVATINKSKAILSERQKTTMSTQFRPNKQWDAKRPQTMQEIMVSILKPPPKWPPITNPRHGIHRQVIYSILAPIANTNFDVTELYDDWLRIAALLARYFGDDEGRELFHDVSRNYEGYDPDKCNKLYSSFFAKPNTDFSINQLQEMAKHYGF